MSNRNWKMTLSLVLIVGILGIAIGHLTTVAQDRPIRPAVTQTVAIPVAEKNQPLQNTPIPAAKEPLTPVRVASKIPTGSWTKQIEVPTYGQLNITWTFQEQKVFGKIEGTIMGVEFELLTESEISVSSHGTIYGLVTSSRLSHLKFPANGPFAEFKQLEGLFPLTEPFLNELMTDLPFSYQYRMMGDRLTILNYRILVSGPNPFGKLGAIFMTGNDLREIGYVLIGIQSIGTALEGSYVNTDAVPEKRKGIRK